MAKVSKSKVSKATQVSDAQADVQLPVAAVVETTATPAYFEAIVTSVVHGPAGAPRVTIFGQTASAVLRWCGAQNWSTKHTFECLQRLGLPITLITVRCQMGSGKLGTAGTRGPVAELTTEQAEALTLAYNSVCKQAAEALKPRVIATA